MNHKHGTHSQKTHMFEAKKMKCFFFKEDEKLTISLGGVRLGDDDKFKCKNLRFLSVFPRYLLENKSTLKTHLRAKLRGAPRSSWVAVGSQNRGATLFFLTTKAPEKKKKKNNQRLELTLKNWMV